MTVGTAGVAQSGPGRGDVTPDAYTYADRVQARVILIDGDTLAKLLVSHNIGVQIQDTYVIKRVDEDFFDEQ